ncbi:MAG: hypothetical protein JOY70_11550 [Acidisphaera sp.]|nr:hypothetical protein [Acidisphaera sp.]
MRRLFAIFVLALLTVTPTQAGPTTPGRELAPPPALATEPAYRLAAAADPAPPQSTASAPAGSPSVQRDTTYDYRRFLLDIGAVIAAGIGWILTVRSWRVNDENNRKLETEKYNNALTLEKRKAELAYRSAQIQLLYGPLHALCMTRNSAFAALMRRVAPRRQHFFGGDPLSAEELRQWRLWRTTALMPILVEMESAILKNAHLIEGDEMPTSFAALLSHVAGYRATIANWETEEGKLALERPGTSVEEQENLHTSVLNFPTEFDRDVKAGFANVKALQNALLRTTSAG